MRSSLTNPSPSKSNYVNFSGKLFNVILVKKERPPLQKSAAWLIEPWQMRARPAAPDRLHEKSIFCTKSFPLMGLYVQSHVAIIKVRVLRGNALYEFRF